VIKKQDKAEHSAIEGNPDRTSGHQEKTCAGCGAKWNHDSVWCPECALKRAVDFATSTAHDSQ